MTEKHRDRMWNTVLSLVVALIVTGIGVMANSNASSKIEEKADKKDIAEKFKSKADLIYVDKRDSEIKEYVKEQNDLQDKTLDEKLDLIIRLLKNQKK